MATVTPSMPKTPEQKHAAARQSQALGRFGGILVLLIFLGLPALGMLVGMALVGLSYRVLLAQGQALAATWPPYGPAIRQYVKAPSQQHWQALQPLIGLVIPLSGELPDWSAKDWVAYPSELLNRHAVVVGGSGTGKTEFLLRLAYLVAKILRWQVFYIDAKGDYDLANRFMATMAHAGVKRAAMFPDLAYNGWNGDATAILNRLMAIEDYSEPYYRAIAKTVLSLTCNAPCGPPRSSVDLLVPHVYSCPMSP
jgi:hypothetical protein